MFLKTWKKKISEQYWTFKKLFILKKNQLIRVEISELLTPRICKFLKKKSNFKLYFPNETKILYRKRFNSKRF